MRQGAGLESAKPNLVLIHGWGLGPIAWRDALPALEARFNVLPLALPGYGEAVPAGNGGPYPAFDETAANLASDLPEGAFVCGWSLGAMLALQIASMAPQRLAGLILVGGTPSFVQRRDWQSAQPPALLDTFCSAIAHDAAGTLQRFVALLNQGDTQARAIGRALNRLLPSAPLADTATLLAGLGWLRDVDLRERIAAVTTPTLLIHGERDPLMPLAAGQWLAATLSDARLAVIPGAAHAPLPQRPGEFRHADWRILPCCLPPLSNVSANRSTAPRAPTTPPPWSSVASATACSKNCKRSNRAR